LRNDIALIEGAFAEFELDKTAFAGLAAVVRELSYRAVDFVKSARLINQVLDSEVHKGAETM